MTNTQLTEWIESVFSRCPGNEIAPDIALLPELAGEKIFEAPLVCVASAQDPLYEKLTQPDVIGPWHMGPETWLPGAKAVISLFFPFTETIKAQQRKIPDRVSPAWLHGRIEGQSFIIAFTTALRDALQQQGISCCAPCIDPRFQYVMNGETAFPGYPDTGEAVYASNWSERHTAYISGLGTFGLSRGIITEKGMAGRLTSLIVDLPLEVTERPYTGLYDYCIFCGVCALRCPVDAISEEDGKDHAPCGRRLAHSRKVYAPRYGCGSCQTSVPCESRNPSKAK